MELRGALGTAAQAEQIWRHSLTALLGGLTSQHTVARSTRPR
jgi:hypothetical protein